MKRLVFDLDGTLALDEPERSYAERRPNLALIARREYRAEGFEIIICTARNMRTHQGSIGRINAMTLPVILAWLAEHRGAWRTGRWPPARAGRRSGPS